MPLKIIFHAPYRLLARQDAKAAKLLLLKVGIPVKSRLGGELLGVLTRQVMAWRDFFTLRGVKMKRETLFIMTARSIAGDAVVAARLDEITAGHGNALLQMFSLLIEHLYAPSCCKSPARVPAAPNPVPAEVPAPIQWAPRPSLAPPRTPEFITDRLAA